MEQIWPKMDIHAILNDGLAVKDGSGLRDTKPKKDFSAFEAAYKATGLQTPLTDMGHYRGFFAPGDEKEAIIAFLEEKLSAEFKYAIHGDLGISVEPEDGSDKAIGLLSYLKSYGSGDKPLVIVIGDGHNDERAQLLALELGGYAFWVVEDLAKRKPVFEHLLREGEEHEKFGKLNGPEETAWFLEFLCEELQSLSGAKHMSD